VRVDSEQGLGVLDLREPTTGRRESVAVLRRGSVWFLSLTPVDAAIDASTSSGPPTRRE
jgi:hypothetical protein